MLDSSNPRPEPNHTFFQKHGRMVVDSYICSLRRVIRATGRPPIPKVPRRSSGRLCLVWSGLNGLVGPLSSARCRSPSAISLTDVDRTDSIFFDGVSIKSLSRSVASSLFVVAS